MYSVKNNFSNTSRDCFEKYQNQPTNTSLFGRFFSSRNSSICFSQAEDINNRKRTIENENLKKLKRNNLSVYRILMDL